MPPAWARLCFSFWFSPDVQHPVRLSASFPLTLVPEGPRAQFLGRRESICVPCPSSDMGSLPELCPRLFTPFPPQCLHVAVPWVPLCSPPGSVALLPAGGPGSLWVPLGPAACMGCQRPAQWMGFGTRVGWKCRCFSVLVAAVCCGVSGVRAGRTGWVRPTHVASGGFYHRSSLSPVGGLGLLAPPFEAATRNVGKKESGSPPSPKAATPPALTPETSLFHPFCTWGQ